MPFRRKSYSELLGSEKNPSTSTGFEPANLGSSGECANHGTIGVDKDVVKPYYNNNKIKYIQ